MSSKRLKFGFECEHFVEDPLLGEILYAVPTNLPHDGNGHLVETRSLPYNSSSAVLESFIERRELLESQLQNLNLRMVTKDEHAYTNGSRETAGFHLHFSKHGVEESNFGFVGPGWENDELTSVIARLEAEFRPLGKIRTVAIDTWRYKPYGWEYRLLPATIDPADVAKWLMKEFRQ